LISSSTRRGREGWKRKRREEEGGRRLTGLFGSEGNRQPERPLFHEHILLLFAVVVVVVVVSR